MNDHENLVQKILDHNARQRKKFANESSLRKRFLSEHPTKFIVFECMDGRVNFPLIAGLPAGIVSCFRSMGGIFDLEIPDFANTIYKVINAARKKNRGSLLVATYHFSKGEHHRGCAGYKYDSENAIAGTLKLCSEMNETFAMKNVYAIELGIETDEDRFVIDAKELEKVPTVLRKDLEFLLFENKKRADNLAIRSVNEMNHCEQVIAVGLGFDWLFSYI